MSTPQQRARWRELEERLEQDAADAMWTADGKTVVVWQDDEKYDEIIADTFDERNAAFIAATRAAVPALLADVDALTQERDNAYRLLESLTPGGSEFSDNPEACAGWARNRVGMTSKIAAERNELRKERDALAAELATERGLLNMVPEYLRYVAAWRAGDGSFLVFNEWVAQRTAEPLLWKASTRPLWTDDAQA